MPNFPSIYLELQEIWKRIRRIEGLYDDHETRITELERITQCMDYISSPTNSTVLACDLRISGSNNPQLYIGPNATDSAAGFNPQNELLVIGKTGDAYLSVTDGTNRTSVGATDGVGSWVGSISDSNFTIRKNNQARITISGATNSGLTEINGRGRITNIPVETNISGFSVVINNASGDIRNITAANLLNTAGALTSVNATTNLTGNGTSGSPLRVTDSVTLSGDLTLNGSAAVTSANSVLVANGSSVVKKMTFANVVAAGGGLTNITNYYGNWSRENTTLQEYGNATTLFEQRPMSYLINFIIPGGQAPGYWERATKKAHFVRHANHVQAYLLVEMGDLEGVKDYINFDSTSWSGATANKLTLLPYLEGGYNGTYTVGANTYEGKAIAGSVTVIGIGSTTSEDISTTLVRDSGIMYNATAYLPNLGGWKRRVAIYVEYFFNNSDTSWDYFYNRS